MFYPTDVHIESLAGSNFAEQNQSSALDDVIWSNGRDLASLE